MFNNQHAVICEDAGLALMVARCTLVGKHHFYGFFHLLNLLLPHPGPGEAEGKREGVLVHVVLSTAQQGLLEGGHGEGGLSKTRGRREQIRTFGPEDGLHSDFLKSLQS